MIEIQPTYDELLQELRQTKRQLSYAETREKRSATKCEKHEQFQELCHAMREVSTSRLPLNEKAALEYIAYDLTFKPENIKRGYDDFTPVDVAYALGMGRANMKPVKENIKETVEKLIKKGLLIQVGKQLKDGYRLRLPENILEILQGLSRRSSRKYTPQQFFCPTCNRYVSARYHSHTSISPLCEKCDTPLATPKQIDRIWNRGELEQEKITPYSELHTPVSSSHEQRVQPPGENEQPPENGYGYSPEELETLWEEEAETRELAALPDTPDALPAPPHSRAYGAKERLEQAEMNGYRLAISTVDGRLVLGSAPGIDTEDWQRAREALRPYDDEIIQLLKEREARVHAHI